MKKLSIFKMINLEEKNAYTHKKQASPEQMNNNCIIAIKKIVGDNYEKRNICFNSFLS